MEVSSTSASAERVGELEQADGHGRRPRSASSIGPLEGAVRDEHLGHARSRRARRPSPRPSRRRRARAHARRRARRGARRPSRPRRIDTDAVRPGDGGLGAGPLADLERVAEEQVERGSGRALGPAPPPTRSRTWPRISCLAEHRRVEPGGHREQVGRGGLVVLAVEVVAAASSGARPAMLREEVADVGVGAVEALGDGVDLGAVARREQHGLADVRAGEQRSCERLGQRSRRRRSCARAARAERAVVQTDDDDGHAVLTPC